MHVKQIFILVFFFTISFLGFSQDLRFKIEGTVHAFDPDNEFYQGQPLGDVKAALKDTSGNEYVTYTDSNGFYVFEFDSNEVRIVLAESDYTIDISAISKFANDGNQYMPSRGYESTKGVIESTRFIKDFALVGLFQCGGDLLFPVLYHKNCQALQPYSEYEPSDSLDYVLQILIENPTITIEISTHSSSFTEEEQNIQCGVKVGEEIINYLVNKGIQKERLVKVSYGAVRPIVSNEEIDKLAENQQEEARMKNNRVDFRVLSFDFGIKAD
jgi:hypothetical protein